VVSEILAGKRSITPETARGLGAAFGTGATFWMNLESAYQLAKTTHDDEAVERRAKLYSRAPVKEMVKRGWIRFSENISVVEGQITQFFGIRNIEDEPYLALAPRVGASNTELTMSHLAWLCRVRQVAKAISVAPYSEKGLSAAVHQMQTLLHAPEEARYVPRLLADCGVRFILVEKIPHGEIDGVCFWLDAGSPVIGMSMRRDKIDNFWFVLRHEIEHVLRRHGQESAVVDVELDGERAGTDASVPEQERVANAAAADFCVPADKINSFMVRKHPFYSERDVVAFARTLNRHPGLVVGQMQYRLNRYDYLTKHLAKVRQFVLSGSIFDGWGQSASV
jgi:HTH-type transcriptional regulator/antitoxin HigA